MFSIPSDRTNPRVSGNSIPVSTKNAFPYPARRASSIVTVLSFPPEKETATQDALPAWCLMNRIADRSRFFKVEILEDITLSQPGSGYVAGIYLPASLTFTDPARQVPTAAWPSHVISTGPSGRSTGAGYFFPPIRFPCVTSRYAPPTDVRSMTPRVAEARSQGTAPNSSSREYFLDEGSKERPAGTGPRSQ